MGQIKRFTTVDDAVRLAEFAYGGLLDKGGSAYVEHPKRVAAQVGFQTDAPYLRVAALLHDVVEDTCITLQMLLDMGIDKDAVDVVDLLTRRKDVPSEDYYARIKEHPGALLVKTEDISDNMKEWRLGYLPPAVQERLRAKYTSALRQLHGVPGESAASALAESAQAYASLHTRREGSRS